MQAAMAPSSEGVFAALSRLAPGTRRSRGSLIATSTIGQAESVIQARPWKRMAGGGPHCLVANHRPDDDAARLPMRGESAVAGNLSRQTRFTSTGEQLAAKCVCRYGLVLQLDSARLASVRGLKATLFWPLFSGLKAPAPSGA